MIRFGLCCVFIDEPIKFRTITATTLSALPGKRRLERVAQICLHNAESLLDVVHTVDRLGIKAFRILSPLLPRYTHPETYPKFQQQIGKVIGLRDMINWCLQHPLEGKALDVNDPKMVALEAYITYERRGVGLDPGKH
jgi:UV DNA damage repair endonuclease